MTRTLKRPMSRKAKRPRIRKPAAPEIYSEEEMEAIEGQSSSISAISRPCFTS